MDRDEILLWIGNELSAFARAADWMTQALHLNSALQHAAMIGRDGLPDELRDRIAEAERLLLEKAPRK